MRKPSLRRVLTGRPGKGLYGRTATEPRRLDALTPDMFTYYPSGALRGGIKWTIKTDLGVEVHETYQFETFGKLVLQALAFTEVPGMLHLWVVTHDGEYKGMRVLASWETDARTCGTCGEDAGKDWQTEDDEHQEIICARCLAAKAVAK